LVTHVLLPVGFFSRRADSARVVGRAAELKAGGLGYRGIAGLLGRPAGTARGWLRSAGVAARAGPDVFRAMAAQVAPDAARVAPRPAAGPVGELVASLSALAAGVGPVGRPGPRVGGGRRGGVPMPVVAGVLVVVGRATRVGPSAGVVGWPRVGLGPRRGSGVPRGPAKAAVASCVGTGRRGGRRGRGGDEVC
jgi:hypothetical protein